VETVSYTRFLGTLDVCQTVQVEGLKMVNVVEL